MFNWFNKKIQRKGISGDFTLEILPLINISAKDVQSMRRRCQRVRRKDITELSVPDLMCHIEIMEDSLSKVENRLMNCNNKIIRERE